MMSAFIKSDIGKLKRLRLTSDFANRMIVLASTGSIKPHTPLDRTNDLMALKLHALHHRIKIWTDGCVATYVLNLQIPWRVQPPALGYGNDCIIRFQHAVGNGCVGDGDEHLKTGVSPESDGLIG